VGDISDDTIGYGLDHLDVESIQKGWYMLARRAKRNGMLRDSPFHDFIVGVFDGIETTSSYNRYYPGCLSRLVETNKGKKIQYYHRAVVLTLVGYDFPIPIGLEMMKKGEGENENEMSKSQSRHLQWHWAKKKNVFAFSKDINHLPPEIVYSIGRHRWDIDANIFMDMVKHRHLKHKTLHFENAYENMLSIRLISYLVFMFFLFRHINSRRKKKIKLYIEMARMLYRSACTNLEPEIILIE
jgi:hypothetical protein